MILVINYSDSRFRRAQKFNTKMALRYGADKVIEWNREKLSQDFMEENKELLSRKRGGGYWIWKPYIIRETLREVQDGDYVIYTDSGCCFVRPISLLLEAMEKAGTDVMCFNIDKPEIRWTKRDALVLMDCDRPEILWSAQICATYIILKKTADTVAMVDEYNKFSRDVRIVSDDENVMGVENYDEFKENRHDQTVWSLLCKKHGIKPFRDPSQFGRAESNFTNDVLARSTYPQVLESHRNENIMSKYELHYNEKWWWIFPRYMIKAYRKACKIINRQ